MAVCFETLAPQHEGKLRNDPKGRVSKDVRRLKTVFQLPSPPANKIAVATGGPSGGLTMKLVVMPGLVWMVSMASGAAFALGAIRAGTRAEKTRIGAMTTDFIRRKP